MGLSGTRLISANVLTLLIHPLSWNQSNVSKMQIKLPHVHNIVMLYIAQASCLMPLTPTIHRHTHSHTPPSKKQTCVVSHQTKQDSVTRTRHSGSLSNVRVVVCISFLPITKEKTPWWSRWGLREVVQDSLPDYVSWDVNTHILEKSSWKLFLAMYRELMIVPCKDAFFFPWDEHTMIYWPHSKSSQFCVSLPGDRQCIKYKRETPGPIISTAYSNNHSLGTMQETPPGAWEATHFSNPCRARSTQDP